MEPEEELLAATDEVDNELDLEEAIDEEAESEWDKSDDGTQSRSALDPTELDDESLIAELQRRGHLSSATQVEETAPALPFANLFGVDPRLAQVVELSHSNPAMAEALRMQIAEERAEARVMERIGPTLAPIANRQAIQNSGLSDGAQQYLNDTFAQVPGLDVAALMSNPVARDVLTRAARQYENERSSRSAPRYESAASEAPTLSAEDWRAIREFERLTGDRVDSDVIKSARRRF